MKLAKPSPMQGVVQAQYNWIYLSPSRLAPDAFHLHNYLIVYTKLYIDILYSSIDKVQKYRVTDQNFNNSFTTKNLQDQYMIQAVKHLVMTIEVIHLPMCQVIKLNKDKTMRSFQCFLFSLFYSIFLKSFFQSITICLPIYITVI